MLVAIKKSKHLHFLTLCFIIVFLLASCSSPVDWHKIETQVSPPAVTAASIAYNSKTQKAVLFGGSNALWMNNTWVWNWSDETWEWNGESWQKLSPANNPPGREKHVMAYDEGRDRIVLFGGASGDLLFNDTWEWDGTDWQLMNPDHMPPARCCHAIAYDSSRRQIILYGGWDSQHNAFFNDIWIWDGEDWSQILSNAPQMSGHFLVNFPSKSEVFSIQTSNAGTWVWDGMEFIDLELENPPSRTDIRAVYDSRNDRAVLFGGIHDKSFLNDTWIFDGSSWFEIYFPVNPSHRFGQVMFYDIKRNSVILFGGFQYDNVFLNDTWELGLPSDLSRYRIALTAIPVPPLKNRLYAYCITSLAITPLAKQC